MDQFFDFDVIFVFIEFYFVVDLFYYVVLFCLVEECVFVLVIDINFQVIFFKIVYEVIVIFGDGGVLDFEWVVVSNYVLYVLINVFFVLVFGLDVIFLNDVKIKR